MILFDDDLCFGKEQKIETQSCEENKKLAEAYVPMQKPGRIYPPEKALIKGTVFPELYRPYQTCDFGGNNGYNPPKFFWEAEL